MLPRSLNREFAFTLNDVARMLRTYADHKASQFGITRAQWVVLVRLDRFEGLKQSELAEMLDLQPITLTRLLDRLCENGLIERRADPNDRRAKRLYLTAQARPLLERLGDLGEELMNTALAGVDREAVERMVAQLAIVKENIRHAIQNKTAPARRESSAMAERALKSIPSERDEAPEVRELPGAVPALALRRGAGPVQKESAQTRPARRRSLGLFAVLPVVLIVGAYWYATGGKVMSTDDAYVDTQKVGISTDVPGIVQAVNVADNERVNAGQVLYRLDPRQYQIALDNAKANLAQTALNIDAMKQDYKRMLSDVAAEQAQVVLDQTNYTRDVTLLHSGTVSQAIYDQAQSSLDTDKSKLEFLRQQTQVQLARLDGNAEIPVAQHPQYLQAQAQVDEAQRQFDHTVIAAPFAGRVADVSAIAPGKYLAASTTAFYLVDTDHAWIEANPKETELTFVRPGQPVTMTVDTYPDVTWHGTVESISPAAAQEFSLCRRKTPAATGSRSSSACRCGCASMPPKRTSRRCAPA